MSAFPIQISYQPAPNPWSEKALVSFSAEQASIHLSDASDLRSVQKAARMLRGMNISQFQLVGEWLAEQQWAFAIAVTSADQNEKIQWCDDSNLAALEQSYQALLFARNLMNGSPQEIYPESLANSAADWLKSLGGERVSYHLVTGKDLQAQGWTGTYHVGMGSERPPTMLQLDFNPNSESAPVDIAMVGKGITFDSGGYSLKSSEGMLHMKFDMGGAATLAAALGLAITQGLNKRVRLYLCCAENLVNGRAYKLGDILHYKNGVSVEVVNTDAEGRLVLADGLIAATQDNPTMIIDAGTLTGAAHVAVGNEYNAFFCMDDELAEQVKRSAKQEHELVWQLPLQPWHQDMCPSPYADTANSRPQKGGGAGGASNAAGFLSRFVDYQNIDWVHFDLAAAFNDKATATMPAGATGYGVRTIASLLLG